MIKKKRRLEVFLVLTMLLMLFPLVNAFAIGSEYNKGNPLKISPGETKNIELVIQNTLEGGSDMTLKAEILEGKEIASLDSLEYFASFGTTDTIANLRVFVPADVAEGTEYQIKVKFTDISSLGDEGTVSLGTSITRVFGVLVKEQEEPAKEKSLLWLWLLLLLVVLVAVYMIYKKQQKPPKKSVKKKR